MRRKFHLSGLPMLPILLVMLIVVFLKGHAEAASSVECKPYDDEEYYAFSSGGIPDYLLLDDARAIKCLIEVLDQLGKTLEGGGWDSSASSDRLTIARLLIATSALQKVFFTASMSDEREKGTRRLNAVIETFRAHDTIPAVAALTYSAQSEERKLRLNAVLILGNVIDNSTVCVPLTFLNYIGQANTQTNVRGRANLLGIVSVVAPWASKENHQTIESTINSLSESELSDTTRIVENIRARLKPQDDQGDIEPMVPAERQSCKTYVDGFKPELASDVRKNLAY